MNSQSFLKSTYVLNQLKDRIKVMLPTCKSCHYDRKMNHYCMQRSCKNKQLVCVQCNVRQPHSRHYGHRFCYVLPLLYSNASKKLQQVAETIRQFKILVGEEIQKIHVYIKSLENVLRNSQIALEQVLRQKQARGLDKFEKLVSQFRQGQDINIENIFKNVNFPMNSECRQKISDFRHQMKVQIDKLNWINDPQKAFKDKLLDKQEQNVRLEPVFLSDRAVEVTQIDQMFKQFNEVYTNKLRENHVILRLDTEYSNKSRMFQNLIYHFQKCRMLSIHNINLNHSKSVLGFSKLKQLELVCNNQCQSFVGFKSQLLSGISSQLTSFKLKKLKEEDTKFLKYIREIFPSLLQLQLQFNNRYDMGSSKDLIDFLKGTDSNLLRISLKFRTQNDIKRLFGNFSKFIKQSSAQNPLQDYLIRYFDKHPNFTRISLDGIRLRKVTELLCSVAKMNKLMHFHLSVMDCPDEPVEVRLIQKQVLKNRRILALLQGLVMRSQIARCSGVLAVEKILDIAISQ